MLFSWATGGDVARLLRALADTIEKKYRDDRQKTGAQVASEIAEALRETAKGIR